MGLTALLPLRRKLGYGFLLPLKIHCPWPALNLRALGPMANMLSTRLSRMTNQYILLQLQTIRRRFYSRLLDEGSAEDGSLLQQKYSSLQVSSVNSSLSTLTQYLSEQSYYNIFTISHVSQ
jgi:hypothetical protein